MQTGHPASHRDRDHTRTRPATAASRHGYGRGGPGAGDLSGALRGGDEVRAPLRVRQRHPQVRAVRADAAAVPRLRDQLPVPDQRRRGRGRRHGHVGRRPAHLPGGGAGRRPLQLSSQRLPRVSALCKFHNVDSTPVQVPDQRRRGRGRRHGHVGRRPAHLPGGGAGRRPLQLSSQRLPRVSALCKFHNVDSVPVQVPDQRRRGRGRRHGHVGRRPAHLPGGGAGRRPLQLSSQRLPRVSALCKFHNVDSAPVQVPDQRRRGHVGRRPAHLPGGGAGRRPLQLSSQRLPRVSALCKFHNVDSAPVQVPDQRRRGHVGRRPAHLPGGGAGRRPLQLSSQRLPRVSALCKFHNVDSAPVQVPDQRRRGHVGRRPAHLPGGGAGRRPLQLSSQRLPRVSALCKFHNVDSAPVQVPDQRRRGHVGRRPAHLPGGGAGRRPLQLSSQRLPRVSALCKFHNVDSAPVQVPDQRRRGHVGRRPAHLPGGGAGRRPLQLSSQRLPWVSALCKFHNVDSAPVQVPDQRRRGHVGRRPAHLPGGGAGRRPLQLSSQRLPRVSALCKFHNVDSAPVQVPDQRRRGHVGRRPAHLPGGGAGRRPLQLSSQRLPRVSALCKFHNVDSAPVQVPDQRRRGHVGRRPAHLPGGGAGRRPLQLSSQRLPRVSALCKFHNVDSVPVQVPDQRRRGHVGRRPAHLPGGGAGRRPLQLSSQRLPRVSALCKFHNVDSVPVQVPDQRRRGHVGRRPAHLPGGGAGRRPLQLSSQRLPRVSALCSDLFRTTTTEPGASQHTRAPPGRHHTQTHTNTYTRGRLRSAPQFKTYT
ncbi:uncharacterized protein LOC134749410 isoform X1 [Cydia strobilella]|uniref:uncharacterized protein LOC134749410 isoform X1 n=1 Tax=Cydia strobilella TaxID=1100964 RepID=UPI00300713B1